MTGQKNHLDPDRVFDSDPKIRRTARKIHESVKDLALLCPHGHVDPALFSDPKADFGNPVELLIKPDHYVLRMLYSQGIGMEELGIGARGERDPRKIWRKFAGNFHLFRGTPTGYWIRDQVEEVFGVRRPLDAKNADDIYDAIDRKLKSPAFRPRELFKKFNIEVLCTTDPATDDLSRHKAIRKSGWKGRILPTFRPDGVLDVLRSDWKANLDRLGDLTGLTLDSYPRYIRALEQRREDFKRMGATATDHGAPSPMTASLSPAKAGELYRKAVKSVISGAEADLFRAHMLTQMARMSVEDGLVMQFHPGSYRNHNPSLHERLGPDKGADIPVQAEYTRNLKPLLDLYGNDPRLTLILFTLDESTYSRELAPLAGHYPALKLGPPWWFNDSLQGMTRFRDQVMETAGLYNTVGFNDDARNFCSIPSRHDLARRVDANWLAGQVARGLLGLSEAEEMAHEMAYGLAKKTYRL